MIPLWWLTKDGDKDCLEMYERHYSAYRYADGRKRNQFVGPGEKVVLRTETLTRSGHGESSSTTADSKASTVQCSAMNQRIAARTSYAKRIKLLIASGLIAGITPTSTRKRSPQRTLDFALSKPAGDTAAEPKADC
jgi:hypothetical protein